MKSAGLLVSFLFLGCVAAHQTTISADRLQGPWFTDSPSFELVIHERTILFEFDMQEHPYRLDGDVLIIDFENGEQRKRILRLTADEMEWQDEKFGTVSVLYRKGIWERSSGNGLIAPPRKR
jgi:hypothetical protein